MEDTDILIYEDELDRFRKSLDENDEEISALVEAVSKTDVDSAKDHFISKINELDSKSFAIKT